MATIEVWIQLENQPWDVCPRRPIDRSTAQGALPVGPLRQVLLRSPVTRTTRTAFVNIPLPGEALILRRYTPDWRQPDDRKVNPWDLNEPDPTDSGTMGTIPGALIECEVGDTVRVRFRNMDFRTMFTPAPWETARDVPDLPIELRTHSLHAHGFVYAREHDGAYPLSPPDPEQPVDANEVINWSMIGVKGFKQGDRVPPGCTFTYVWEARTPSSAGVWHYHDHSIAHHESTARGAIGMIVVRNPDDVENEVEITPERLPGGSWTASPIEERSVVLPDRLKLTPYALGLVGGEADAPDPGAGEGFEPATLGGLEAETTITWGGVRLELTDDLDMIRALAFDAYREPPDQVLFLLLFHEMPGVGMCINGRKYLGNAPTLVAGPKTRMRFGVAGAGDAFHTFHVHGHRWVVQGPAGADRAAIATSPQDHAVSPFEDVVVFGPASSFAFTVDGDPGVMRPDPPLGEWHLHCHVGHHMMEGMVGSLLVINGGELALPLPVGRGAPEVNEHGSPWEPPSTETHQVKIYDTSFSTPDLTIQLGDEVIWVNADRRRHFVISYNQTPKWIDATLEAGETVLHKFNALGKFHYYDPARQYPNEGSVTVIAAGGSAQKSSGQGPAPAPPTGGPTTHQVQITSTGFSPSSVSIKAGDSVKWTNQDSAAHTATSDDHSWTTPTLTSGKSFSRPFPTQGTFAYHCHFHHEMTATVNVAP